MSFCAEYLSAYLFAAMASSNQQTAARHRAQERNIRGPPCNKCVMNSGVPMCQIRDRLTTPERRYIRLHYPEVQILCYDCLQDILDERHMRWWKEVFHDHIILDDPVLKGRISQYLWTSIGYHKCWCGRCDPFWLSRGWRCWV